VKVSTAAAVADSTVAEEVADSTAAAVEAEAVTANPTSSPSEFR
jgi:hypothetical protein